MVQTLQGSSGELTAHREPSSQGWVADSAPRTAPPACLPLSLTNYQA